MAPSGPASERNKPPPSPLITPATPETSSTGVTFPTPQERDKVDERERSKHQNRPRQGDWALILEMNPNRTATNQRATEQAPDSESDGSGADYAHSPVEEVDDVAFPESRATTNQPLREDVPSPRQLYLQNTTGEDKPLKPNISPKPSIPRKLNNSKLRASCDSCATSKVECGKEHPTCARCSAINSLCIYGISRKQADPGRIVDDIRYVGRSLSRVNRGAKSSSAHGWDKRSHFNRTVVAPNLNDEIRNWNDEIRLRVAAEAPVNVQLADEMEGRNSQLIPVENYTTELFISGSRDEEDSQRTSERQYRFKNPSKQSLFPSRTARQSELVESWGRVMSRSEYVRRRKRSPPRYIIDDDHDTKATEAAFSPYSKLKEELLSNYSPSVRASKPLVEVASSSERGLFVTQASTKPQEEPSSPEDDGRYHDLFRSLERRQSKQKDSIVVFDGIGSDQKHHHEIDQPRASKTHMRKWLTAARNHLGGSSKEKLDPIDGRPRWNPVSPTQFPEIPGETLRNPDLEVITRAFARRRNEREISYRPELLPPKYEAKGVETAQDHESWVKSAACTAAVKGRERTPRRRDTLEVPKEVHFSYSQSIRDALLLSGRHPIRSAVVTPEEKRLVSATDQIDDDESVSGLSSSTALVAQISATSSSGISRSTGYSAMEVATATKILLSVFYENAWLSPFYERAIEHQNIGPARLQKKLHRLLRACAAVLYGEAIKTTQRVEHLAARLVHEKSAFLAQYIVKTLLRERERAQSPRCERGNDDSDDEDDRHAPQHSMEKVFLNEAFRKFVENDKINLDPWVEEDIRALREFLVGSKAFKAFQEQVTTFACYSSPAGQTETVTKEMLGCDESVNKNDVLQTSSQSKLTLEWRRLATVGVFFTRVYNSLHIAAGLHLTRHPFVSATNHLLVVFGLLEPALGQNKIRLRWRCHCGDSIYSDMIELCEGGIPELVDHMQRSSGVKVLASPYNNQSGNQQYIVPRPDRWIRNAVTKIISVFGGPWKSSSGLPQHNAQCATASCSTSSTSTTQMKILHLSMCMHRTRRRKIVKQDRVEDITTDRTLLRFLQQQYNTHRGRFLNIARLKTVQRIVFVKFRLPMGGSVDVQHHLYCIADPANWKYCECTPPPNKVGVEYEYSPSPPKTHPPIPPEYLASLFTCATDVHEDDDWILNQLPKRTCGVLQGQKGQPAEGWGIYFLEGWDREIISLFILLIFTLASLLFGILWWKFQFDLQGAFGVSQYLMAVCAIIISVIVTRLENKG